MRRFVLFLLIALLPLQSIWAAGTGNCHHPRGAAGSERANADVHVVKATKSDGASAQSGTTTTCCADCATCFACGAPAAAPVARTLPLSKAVLFAVADESFSATCVPENPLRPPVLVLA